MTKRLCVLQHAEGEGLGSLQSWFTEQIYAIERVYLHRGDQLPEPADYDWVVVMGGPMSVYEETEYPWLIAEKAWLREIIEQPATKLLGICLGAQLMASALGAKVELNSNLEIGWHPITRTHSSASWMPAKERFLSWHGDRFDLPAGATGFAKSEVTPNQGFFLSPNKWALQFHIEAEPGTTKAFLQAGGGHLPQGPWVQNLSAINSLNHLSQSAATARALLSFIDRSI